MKTLHKALLLGLLAGLCFWLLDAVLDSFFFYQQPFLDLLVLEVPAHEIYMRLLALVLALVFALLVGAFAAKRKRAEEALRASEGQLHTLIESSHEVIFCKDREGLYHTMNLNAAIGLGGTCIGHVAGKTDYELLPKEQADALRRTDKYIMESGKDTEVEEVVRNAQGANRLYLSHKWPTYDDEGKITGIACFAMDITERKKAEEEIRQQKDWAEQYLNIAEVTLCIVDRNENISMMNEKGCAALGYSRDELIGRNWFDLLLPKRIRKEIKEVFNKLMVGNIEPVEYYENPLLRKGGEERSFAFHNTLARILHEFDLILIARWPYLL